MLVKVPSNETTCRNFIGGHWAEPAGGSVAKVVSPYVNRSIGQVLMSTPDDIEKAVAAAKEAFPHWRAMPIKERCQILFRFRQNVLNKIDEISHIAAAECGKTFAEAKAGVMKGLEVVEFALSLQNMDAGSVQEVSRGVTCQYKREPLGVVVGITPFNFPAMVPMWMYPIAIAVGNCFILKPSEKVPLTSQIMANIFKESGLPDGVFSIVNGNKETVNALIDHADVKAVAFVGSTPVAKAVYQRASQHGKRALALGGAKNHIILAPDADEDIAVSGIVSSFTGCAGQRCMAGSLLIAVGDCDSILEKVRAAAAAIRLGDDMGAIIDKAAFERIQGAIGQAEKEGAKLLLDGRVPQHPREYEGGNWLAPTIIDQAKPNMACAKNEIFGPVLSVIRAKNLAEAMQLENECPFGNATSIFTTSGAVAKYVSDHASTGMVGVNVGVPVPREPFSFGGTKDSKFGHGDITGMSSLDFWTDLKKITTKWSLQKDHNWMS